MKFAHRRVTVIGLSESGFSAAKLLKRLKAHVRVSELRDDFAIRNKLKSLGEVEFEIGRHTRDFVRRSDVVIASPGVRSDADPLRWATEANIPIIGELELGCIFCHAQIAAVTGTNGKSTTVSLLHEMFKANGVKSNLLGNIGRPICEDALDISFDSVVALEVSSFQLETIKNFRPHVAVFLNLTQNHLDRYPTMNEYKKAKLRIFENQGSSDYAVLNYDDPRVREMAGNVKSEVYFYSINKKVKGGYIEKDELIVDVGKGPVRICKIQDVNLRGAHNIQNILAAAITARLIYNKADVATAIRSFKGLRHRIELIAEVGGVKFIDDSKSTTVDSTLRALEAIPGNNVILIAGGRNKGSDYSPIIPLTKRLKYLILIGEAKDKIRKCLSSCDIAIEEAPALQDAVYIARGIARRGDVILLSPMCSSFDMFKDYKERGEVFRKAVFESADISSRPRSGNGA